MSGPADAALAAYQRLRDTCAYAQLDIAAQLRCWADPTRLRGWLAGPSDLPGFTHATVAQTWNIDDDFTWDADGIGAAMATLIEQAQKAGVYGAPGHTISLRHVTTDDPDADPAIAHQVTLRTPSGAALASDPIATDHLADDDLSGIDAAIAVLVNTAHVANELLAAEGRIVTAAHDHHQTRPASRPARGFGPLDLGAPTAAPAAIEAPPARPDRRPHR